MTLAQQISLLASRIEAKKLRLLERLSALEDAFESASTDVPTIVGLVQNSKPLEFKVPGYYRPVYVTPSLV